MSHFEISDERKQFLLDNFVEYSFEQDEDGNDLQANKSLFNSISNAEEIFYLAQSCNWDDGAIIPKWIIESPLCTKATALTIFWQSAPDEYMEHEFGSQVPGWKGEIDDEQTEILNILEQLVTRFKNNDFLNKDIAFDFSVWGGKLIVKEPKWAVSDEFFKSVNGVIVE
ncbi:MAG: DUF4274 domain-containing protein [Cognaticolwellia sp.]